MKNLMVVLLLLLVACKSSTNILRPEGMFKGAKGDEPVDINIDSTSVEKQMAFLASDELLGRSPGTEGILKAAEHIEKVFKQNNIKPYFASYKDTLTFFVDSLPQRFKPAFNIVGFSEGNDSNLKNEFILIGAHYDHIGFGQKVENDSIANGANDNATGTTAILELAKYFGNTKNHKRSLLFVAFSAEEKGLLGSKHLAKKLKDSGFNLYTMVNFEMIGVPMKASYKAYLTGYEVSNMAEKMNGYAGKELIGFLPQAQEYQLFKRSDNYPFFQEFTIPAQTVSTFDFTNYPYYHHVKDEVSLMDFAHMAGLINEMVPVITAMANSPSKEIKMNE